MAHVAAQDPDFLAVRLPRAAAGTKTRAGGDGMAAIAAPAQFVGHE
jgi:hypothetical protein